jgi:hypothetical protein
VKGTRMPAWLDDARWYYSEIGGESGQPVSVFRSDSDVVDSESPGTLCLRLEPRFRYSPRVRVLDAGGQEMGIIRPEGLAPGVRYAMRRDGELLWTPFFWWQHLTGTTVGGPRLLGGLGPVGWIWMMWIEPGRDSFDLLAAVAFMHRQWSRM